MGRGYLTTSLPSLLITKVVLAGDIPQKSVPRSNAFAALDSYVNLNVSFLELDYLKAYHIA